MLVSKKEAIAVRGTCYWVIDKKGKVLLDYHTSKEEAEKRVAEREAEDKACDWYVPEFYKVIESDITKLMKQGYKLEFV